MTSTRQERQPHGRAGHIHGIIGENGAGKSTLVSILYGFYGADGNAIRINGGATTIRNSADAINEGIGMVHGIFMLVPALPFWKMSCGREA